ncbi:transposase domain-containing protein [Streptomyces sp. NPDC001296]
MPTGAPLSGQCVITREIAVAEGVFAPGHLGELTRIVPFEMVDEALAAIGTPQSRLRKLPARVVVYLLLAAGLFEQVGYLSVWCKLTSALDGLPIPTVTATALWHARARLGARPIRALFDLLRGPAATALTGSAHWGEMLVCAIDGTCLDVPDNPRTRHRLGKTTNQYATAGYPQICLTALVACGTRAVIDAAFGARGDGSETALGLRLARSLHTGMIVLLDRGFATNAFLTAVARTGADLLARLTSVRKIPVLHRYRDGSYRSVVGDIPVRIIECEITIATSAGRQTGLYRLATTLLDHRRTRRSNWSSPTTSAGRWNPPTSRSRRPCSADASYVPAPRPVSPRRSTPC